MMTPDPSVNPPHPAWTLAPVAARKLHDLLQEAHLPEVGGVRLSVRSGGCFGASFTLDLLPAPLLQDTVMERDGIRFFVPAYAQPYLEGVTLTYKADSSLGEGDFCVFQPSHTPPSGCGL